MTGRVHCAAQPQRGNAYPTCPVFSRPPQVGGARRSEGEADLGELALSDELRCTELRRVRKPRQLFVQRTHRRLLVDQLHERALMRGAACQSRRDRYVQRN